MRDLSSLTRDQTHTRCCGSTESKPLDRQGIPPLNEFLGFHVEYFESLFIL